MVEQISIGVQVCFLAVGLGFFISIGAALASRLFPVISKRQITYDNLDKKPETAGGQYLAIRKVRRGKNGRFC